MKANRDDYQERRHLLFAGLVLLLLLGGFWSFKRTATTQAWQVAPVAEGQWLELTVGSGDTLTHLFRRHQLATEDLRSLLRLPIFARTASRLKPGQNVLCLLDGARRVMSLSLALPNRNRLLVERQGERFSEREQVVALHWHDVMREVVIESSLFKEGMARGISPRELLEVSHILGNIGGLQKRLLPGDRVAFITRQYQGQDKPPTIVALRWKHGHDRFHQVIRFSDHHYYHRNGQSILPSFLQAPLAYRRVSSPFNLHRFHPILHKLRPHKGVDLAAPYGRPIWATADGVVRFRGYVRGYGRVVRLQHAHGMETLYAHMSRFSKGLRVGQRVKAKHVIGYVGMSGLATGPHCHYEVLLNHHPVDPLKSVWVHHDALHGQAVQALGATWQAVDQEWQRLKLPTYA